jgi:hypothetical protein
VSSCHIGDHLLPSTFASLNPSPCGEFESIPGDENFYSKFHDAALMFPPLREVVHVGKSEASLRVVVKGNNKVIE